MTYDPPQLGSMLLSSVPPDARAALLARSKPVRYAAGTLIYGRDAPGETMLVIERGRVEISMTALSGRKSVLNHMGPGEALGEIALLDGGPRSADAVAASDVEGRIIHRRDVIDFVREHPEAMLGLVRELCDKVRNASDMFSSQAETDASARLARCLLKLAEKWGQSAPGGYRRVPPEFSQSDLGDFAGLSRENVNRRLRSWAGDRMLATGAEGILLLDEAGLADIARL